MRDVLSGEVRSVMILPLVIVGNAFGFQQSSGQFGVGHSHRLCIGDTDHATNLDFALEVFLTDVNQHIGCIDIVVTVKFDFSPFCFCKRTVNIKCDSRFFDRYTKMTLDSLEG
ncbi:MAG: hypothetical protein J6D17_14795 [Bacteroides sp.]|nr:hypothetical protein [Bacteroides sp.]